MRGMNAALPTGRTGLSAFRTMIKKR